MRGIKLKDSVDLFGFKDGFNFWFRWSFIDPLEQFWWLNVSHKPYCLEHGWVCRLSFRNPAGCNAKKLTTKKEILEHWDCMNEEIREVEKGNNGNCVYCNKRKGKVEIPNPNMDKINSWLVCLTCKEVIENQQKLTMGSFINNDEMMLEAHNNLTKISKEIGEPIMYAEIRKDKGGKYNLSGIEYTAEEE